MDQGNELDSVVLPPHQMMAPSSKFFIDKQESLVTEKFSKNGRLMDLHLVAKNVAFSVHLCSSFDMNHSPPTAKLVYDWDEEMGDDKEVEQLKTPPLEIIAHVDRSGKKANVETKISVLSSQHERAFFRIKFIAIDPHSGEMLSDFSQPIKVIAKRNQVRKMLERKLQSQVKNENSIVSTPVGVVNLAQLAPKRERPTQDAILETLQRIEDQQLEQYRFMQQLAEKALLRESALSPPTQSNREPLLVPSEPDLETAFRDFVEAFDRVKSEERPLKMRKLSSSIDKNQAKSLEEFVRLYNSETKMPPLEDISSCNYCPGADCPHKTELEMLNNLYTDFLKDPVSPEMT